MLAQKALSFFLFFPVFFNFEIWAAANADEAPTIDGCDRDHDLVCQEGWEIKENCGKVYCYRSVEVAVEQRNLKSFMGDMCAQSFEGSKTLSIHCEYENDYLWKFGSFAIGLYLPPGEKPNGRKNWKWVDGSPYDFTLPWDIGNAGGAPYFKGNNENDYNVVYYKAGTGRYGWIDGSSSGFSQIICKMPAAKVKKTQPCTQNLEMTTWLPQGTPRIIDGCAKIYDFVCPKEWQMWEVCGKVQCYNSLSMAHQKKEHQTMEWFMKDICALNYNGSKFVSVHCDKENELLYKYDNLLMGAYISPNKPVTSNEWQWTDGSAWDYKFWEKNYQGKNAPYRNTSDARVTLFRGYYGRVGWVDVSSDWALSGAGAVCKQPAIKRERTFNCPQNVVAVNTQEAPIIDVCETEHSLVCPDGWELKENCGKVYCYRSLEVAPEQRNLKSLMEDMCAQSFEGSQTLSIHCEEENNYLWKFENFAIGLYLPHDEKKGSKNFKWVDGSPIDYPGFWDTNQGATPAPYYEGNDFNVIFYKAAANRRFGWIDRPQTFEGFSKIVCKMPASKVKKSDGCSAQASEIISNLPKINPPIKEACAKVYDYKCPEGWKVWETCGKIQCYFVYKTKQEERTIEWLMKDTCTHHFPNSKTLSVHCAKENELIWQFQNFILGLYVPPNLPTSSHKWQWVDGSPVDFTGWETNFLGYRNAPFMNVPEDRCAYFRGVYIRYGWVDNPPNAPAHNQIVCKQPAIKVERTANCASPTPPQVTTTPIIRMDPTIQPSVIPPRRSCHI